MEYSILKSFDNEKLYLKIYKVDNPKGAIQIVHGMMEHQERYRDFAHFLNQNGYTVITSDLRGHGSNCTELGFFKNKYGYKALIKDQIEITNYIKNELKIQNVILFGHSMGSIITRNVIKTSSQEYEKVILSGFPNYNKFAPFAILLSNIIKLFEGKHSHSTLLEKGALGPFEKAIKDRKTNLDWLSVNKENVDEYIKDPLCGFKFSNQAYNDLFHLMYEMGKTNLKNVKEDLPILLLNGENDPCVGSLKGIKVSRKILKKQGFKNQRHISYPRLRHEILKEKEKDIVYKDILNFVEEKYAKCNFK